MRKIFVLQSRVCLRDRYWPNGAWRNDIFSSKVSLPHAVSFAFMHVKELVDEDFTYTTTVYQLTPPFALDV